MKKALVLMLTVLTLLAGCEFFDGFIENDNAGNGGNTENDGNETVKPDIVATITVMNCVKPDDPNYNNEMKEIWENFKKEHPEIEIKVNHYNVENYYKVLEVYTAAGALPDVVYVTNQGTSALVQETGVFKDIMPLLERDGLKDSYTEVSLSSRPAGYLSALPSGTSSSHMMFANLKVLRENGLELPKTMQDLIDMVPVLNQKGIEVIGMDNKDDWVMESCLFSLIAGRFGGSNWDEELEDGKTNFNGDWFVNALKTVETLYETGVISRDTLDNEYTSSREQFAAGKCAFYIDGDWGCLGFQEDPATGKALLSREQQANDIALTVFPEIEGEKYHNTTSGVVSQGYAINKNLADGSPEAEAAWTLVKYLQGKQAQEFRLKTGQMFPSNKTVDVAKVVKDNDLEPLVEKRAEFHGKWTLTPVIDNVMEPDVSKAINEGLQEIARGTKTAEQVAAETNNAWLGLKK